MQLEDGNRAIVATQVFAATVALAGPWEDGMAA
jgi:hypothetical protein